jgi:hypothetical protein
MVRKSASLWLAIGVLCAACEAAEESPTRPADAQLDPDEGVDALPDGATSPVDMAAPDACGADCDTPGRLGGACFEDGRCDPGLTCEDGRCLPCNRGTLACACAEGGCVEGLVCVDDQCIEAAPAPTECYTPCASARVDTDGRFIECPADGLMPGCHLDGQTCRGGACLPPGAPEPTCTRDLDCPDWQACEAGRCASNCTADHQCPSDARCVRKVCRQTCDIEAAMCPEGEACESPDGVAGHCVPGLPAEGEPQLGSAGAIEVSRPALILSDFEDSAVFSVINPTDAQQTVVVRKLDHLVVEDDGTRDRRRDADARIPCDMPCDEREVAIEARCLEAGDSPAVCAQEVAADRAACDPQRQCPLAWLDLGLQGEARRQQSIELQIAPRSRLAVEVSNAGGAFGVRWEGTLEIWHETLGTRRISLNYKQKVDGHWSGSMYSFAQFATGGLAEWRALPHGGEAPPFGRGTRDDDEARNRLQNAFLRQWATFRAGRMGLAEFRAVLASTRTESWNQPGILDACEEETGNQNARCYPFEGTRFGVKPYTFDHLATPVPNGVVELPIGLYLRGVPGDEAQIEGRIDSSIALHYAGGPAVTIRLHTPASECSREALGSCFVFFDPTAPPLAHAVLGGRYERPAEGGGCAAGFESVDVPWLPVGFERNTFLDPRYGVTRAECRSTVLPFGAAETERNTRLAGSNPVPDGRARRRELQVVDGAFLNNSVLFLIYEERMASFLGPEDPGFANYGYMVLTRDNEPPEETDEDGDGRPDVYQGAEPPPVGEEPEGALDLRCAPELVARVLGQPNPAVQPERLVRTLMDGIAPDQRAAACIQAGDGFDRCLVETGEEVHYLCEDEGIFDDGGDALPCPAGSDVVYFTLRGGASPPADHVCNTTGECAAVLDSWRQAGRVIQLDPTWVCNDEVASICTDDRDLRQGKVFLPAAEARVSFTPLLAEVDRAFRYKTRFRNRDGTNLGFAPVVCAADFDRNPYCYDPHAIEAVRERIDCLLAVWQDDAGLHAGLSPATRTRLRHTLAEAFAVGPSPRRLDTPRAELRDGFERLYAELLILQGDEAFTSAFASRFDLAGVRAAFFPGTAFEPGGVDLAGVPGAEMQLLYAAWQHYQEALDRLARLAPAILQSVEGTEDRDFVTLETVTEYIERLVRASTQKTRAVSAIATRYQSLNRPDLARGLIERSFTAAFLESVILARMLLGIVENMPRETRAQIFRILTQSQQKYQSALLEMREVYQTTGNDLTYFGFPPDYIPFPAVDVRETNAVENALARAEQKLRVAREREELAIAGDRAFETDAAEFQAELVRIRNTYENQLAELCGTLEGPGGVPYPAIRKYAPLVPALSYVGDPCGLVGTGELHRAMAEVEVGQIELQAAVQRLENAEQEIELERRTLARQCGLSVVAINRTYLLGNRRVTLNDEIRENQFIIERVKGTVGAATTIANLANTLSSCTTAICAATAGTSFSTIGSALAGQETAVGFLEEEINDKQLELDELAVEEAVWNLERECAAADVLADQRIDLVRLRMKEQQLDALRESYQLRLALSEVERLHNKATRLQLEQAEAEQLRINIEAARNDPNVRIYRNDAILNADFSFDAAVREAWRTTLVYEYYTSQSHARKGDLFLTRLVSRGDQNLENYLADLSDAFFTFEETHGLPNLRVMVLSLRDDILRVPRVGSAGEALSAEARIERLRTTLRNPSLLDENGYLSIPFDTRLDQVSPATRNHKVRFIEASINANSPGDSLARLYLQQRGTNVVRTLGGETAYYRFPPVTAVLNPYFSGNRGVFEASVYSNERLRDRPLLGTEWRLIINQRDEQVNQDLDLQSLNDIQLFIYYTDFTEL